MNTIKTWWEKQSWGGESIRGNADAIHKLNSSDETEKYGIGNTPFVVWKNEGLYYVIMGKYRMSDGFKTKQAAIKDAKRIDMNRILQVIVTVTEANNKKEL